MAGNKSGWAAALVLGLVLLLPCRGNAGPLLDNLMYRKAHCPPTSYSPCHYWTPTLERVCAHFRGGVSMYAADLHPDVPPSYRVSTFPCPAVKPADLPPYGTGLFPR